MSNEKVYGMSFSKIYPLLVTKAEKKGRTLDEVTQVITWLTGYTAEEIERAAVSSLTYGDFFRNAPQLNPNRKLITGAICGVRVETIEEPLMQEIRYLDTVHLILTCCRFNYELNKKLVRWALFLRVNS